MKRIISIFLVIMLFSISMLGLTGCGSKESSIEERKAEIYSSLDETKENLKRLSEGVDKGSEELKKVSKETADSITVNDTDDINENEIKSEDEITNDVSNKIVNNKASFASEAKEESSLESPIKFGESIKAYLNNTVYMLEDFNDRYAPVYLRLVKRNSNEEALKDLRAYNSKFEEKPIYQHEEKLDKYEWHEAVFDIDYKDFPTLNAGATNVGPTFSVYKKEGDYTIPYCEAFVVTDTTTIHQGDVVQFKVLYQWPIGREDQEILTIGIKGIGTELVYFLVDE